MAHSEKLPIAGRTPADMSPIFSEKTEILHSGKEIFNKMLRLINTAKYSIDMQYYSFEADQTGRRILDAVKKAKEKNPSLRVRLLVDNSIEHLHNGERVGSSEDAKRRRDETNELLMQMRDEGILETVDVTNRFDLKNRFTNYLRLGSNILHRDHKKLFLVDTIDSDTHPDALPKAIVGSANVTHYHENHWKDGGRYFEGGNIVKVLAEDFEYTAKHAEKWQRIYEVENPQEYIQRYGLKDIIRHPVRTLGDLRGAVVRNAERRGQRIITTPDPLGRKERDEVVATDSFWPTRMLGVPLSFGGHKATDEAYAIVKQARPEETITASSPYPGFFLFTRRLIRAARHGVHVELIIPAENNHPLYNHKKIDTTELPRQIPGWLQNFVRRVAHTNLDFWEKRLSRAGVHLYKYTGKNEGLDGMLHFKGMLLQRRDGTTRSLNGSLNFTKGPFSGLNREVIVTTEGKINTDPMVGFMQELKAGSEYVSPKKTYTRRTKIE